MRRQAGVDAVDIDTRKSTCFVGFEKPRKLDFGEIDSAAKDAQYAMIGIDLTARGTVVMDRCDTCESDVSYLQLTKDGDRIELSKPAPKGATTLSGTVLDWDTEHPRLQVK
ncbi:MAG: hypothetical protein P1V35_03610 [Planctomycetota bacterium]|nr:hypothetical protein [Planctomycetota bacterium]